MTVSTLARAAGVSRSAVLYYERIGLLRPARRTKANYRAYGQEELERLNQILSYRSAGLTLTDIRLLLDRPESDFAAILRRRLVTLGEEVERLREHQRAIGKLLQNTSAFRRKAMITKEKWVGVMRASGFSEDDMHRWHAQFERAAPEEHEEFLRFIHIPEPEVRGIRDWSRSYPAEGRKPKGLTCL